MDTSLQHDAPGSDWDESSAPTATEETPAAPQAPTQPPPPEKPSFVFPKNPSRHNILVIKQRAEDALKANPNDTSAKTALAEAQERLGRTTVYGTPIPRSEEQKAADFAKVKADARNIEVPTDLKAAFELWRQICQLPQRTPAEKAFKQWRKKFVGPKIHAMQQGMPTIQPDANRLAPASAKDHLSRKEQRELRLAALQAALENPSEIVPSADADPIRHLLLTADFISESDATGPNDPGPEESNEHNENRVPELLFAARQGLQHFHIAYLESWTELNPTLQRQELAAQVTPDKSKAEIDDLKDQILRLNMPEATAFKAAAHQKVLAAWQPARATLSDLFSHTRDIIARLKDGAIFSEKAFFATHGLDREPTSASRRFDGLLKELSHHIARSNSVGQWGVYPIQGDELKFFGLQDII